MPHGLPLLFLLPIVTAPALTSRLENAPQTATTYELRTDLGCARDKPIASSMKGGEVYLSLPEADLADAFACVISASGEDESTSEIAVSPELDFAQRIDDVRFDSIAVAAGSFDPTADSIIRVAFVTQTPAHSATFDLEATTYRALVTELEPYEGGASRVTFEIPARAWAHAVIERKSAHIAVRDEANKLYDVDASPIARVEILGELDEHD